MAKGGKDGKPAKLTVKRLTVMERQVKALQLRVAGATLREIAEQLGYAHPSGAADAIDAALNLTIIQPVETERKLDLARLDNLLLMLWVQARAGNGTAIDRILRVMERRSRLLGLDRPLELDVNWREQATRAGLNPNEVLERMVAEIITSNANGVGQQSGG